MRTALIHSKNLASIRILQAIGPAYAQDYITRFGFDKKHHPAVLPMALGAGSVTPMQMAIGYATFANGDTISHPTSLKELKTNKVKLSNSRVTRPQIRTPNRL